MDGIIRLDELPKAVKAMGMTAVSCTDHGTGAGLYDFIKQCKKEDVKPIPGMEVYWAQDRLKHELDDLENKYYHLIVLAQNQVGLSNLFKMNSQAWEDGLYYKGRIDDSLLETYNEGLLVTSACLGGIVAQLLNKGNTAQAEAKILYYKELFKDRFFLELQTHDIPEQNTLNEFLISMNKKWGLPLTWSGDCLTPGQPIVIETGSKNIEDIEVGDLVLTHTGNFKEVVARRDRDYFGKVYKFCLQRTNKFIEVTSEHPILVQNDCNEIVWKPAKDIVLTDKLTFPRSRKEEKVFVLNQPLNEDIAWFLGIFVAEGSISYKRKALSEICFSLSPTENQWADKIVRIAKKYFGLSFSKKGLSNEIRIRKSNKALGEFLSVACLRGARNKRVPLFLHNASIEIKEAFLQGLFDGDSDHKKSAQLATASKNLAWGVKKILADLGYWGNVSYIKRKCQTGIFDQWLITWTKDKKHIAFNMNDNYLFRSLSNIEVKDYSGKVYNIEVKEDNSYVGEVVVHNCHYLNRIDGVERDSIHEILLGVQTQKTIDDPKKFSFDGRSHWVMSPEEVWQTIKKNNLPEECFTNPGYIASMCTGEYFIEKKNHMPKFGGDSYEVFETKAKVGLSRRFGGASKIPQEYKDRLLYEISMIKQMGFPDYFLIVEDFVNWAKENNIPVGPGRGCFLPGTKVKMATGKYEVIDSIKIEDEVISHDSTHNKVINTLSYLIDEDIVILELENNNIIKCTKDHLFWTLNRGWVQAIDITEQDDIVSV